MLTRIAFLHTTDERFIALCEMVTTAPGPRKSLFSLSTFDHENTFLKLAATIDLPTEVKVDIIAAVLLSVAEPVFPHRWVEVNLRDREIASLGLSADVVEAPFVEQNNREQSDGEIPALFQEHAEQFYRFLNEAPTPFVLMSGPEHTVSFINPPYLRLIGRLKVESVVGKTIREVLPELAGQPFFGLLDEVYRSGQPYVGVEALAKLKSELTGEVQDCFFDFIYHPLRSRDGQVAGIMVQATEVTERVLSRHAMNSREEKLYAQWLELETIYETAPVGVILFDAASLKILRINKRQAEVLGMPPSDLEGKPFKDVSVQASEFAKLLERASLGEPVRDAVIQTFGIGSGQKAGRWLVNLTPIRDKSGAVEKVYSISLEMPVEVLQ